MHRILSVAGFCGLIALGLTSPASAQTAPGTEPSMGCRLFPLACPGPVPAAPAPLLGTPEERAMAAAPAAEPEAKPRHKARKHAVPAQ